MAFVSCIIITAIAAWLSSELRRHDCAAWRRQLKRSKLHSWRHSIAQHGASISADMNCQSHLGGPWRQDHMNLSSQSLNWAKFIMKSKHKGSMKIWQVYIWVPVRMKAKTYIFPSMIWTKLFETCSSYIRKSSSNGRFWNIFSFSESFLQNVWRSGIQIFFIHIYSTGDSSSENKCHRSHLPFCLFCSGKEEKKINASL